MATSCRDHTAPTLIWAWLLRLRLPMLSLLHHRGPPPSPSPRQDDGSLACYGVVVTAASLLLFIILAATVSLAKAGALAAAAAAAAAVVFGAAGCVSRACANAEAAPALPTTVTPAACALVDVAIDALPAFVYKYGHGADGGSSKAGRSALCPVCLEKVEAGEVVRQLPACGHLFHVECTDMWLHSHATCPLCRSEVSPRRVGGKLTAAGGAPDGGLPPV